MLKAKLDSIRKNKKGFSLVELIIVVAIMVALIAVLAPSYVKYVNKSRDAALQTAAEDLCTAIKTAYGDPDNEYNVPALTAAETIKVSIDATNKALKVTGGTNLTAALLIQLGGLDTTKKMNVGTSGLEYTIVVGSDGKITGPTSNK